MFLTKEDLSMALYEEVIDAISRDDDGNVQAAIDGAIEEVASYLNDYDDIVIFSKSGDDRHPLVLIYAKDIAVWHFIAIANPAVEMDVREKRYNAAIAWLKRVQKRDIKPRYLPLKPTEGANPTGVKRIIMGSNPKRQNHN
jgi:phage gp36-like protein